MNWPGLGRLTEEAFVCELGVGYLLLADGLPLALELPAPARSMRQAHRGESQWTLDLERYFAGEPVTFKLDVDAYADGPRLHGLRARRLPARSPRVPYGQAVSYRDLATAAGRPNAYRAVGSAMARNALPVILPCHRVIKNDGRLGSYGDDPAWKERLLALEGVRVVDGRVA